MTADNTDRAVFWEIQFYSKILSMPSYGENKAKKNACLFSATKVPGGLFGTGYSAFFSGEYLEMFSGKNSSAITMPSW